MNNDQYNEMGIGMTTSQNDSWLGFNESTDQF